MYMQRLILESDDELTLEILKTYATQFQSNVEVVEEPSTDKKETDDYYYWKGVKIFKAKQPLDVQALSGSFPNIDIDPKTYRQTLWNRNKE
jgi:hypothetical protein